MEILNTERSSELKISPIKEIVAKDNINPYPPLYNTTGNPYCPICNHYYERSEYLASAISDNKIRFIANLVTHYRHTHISSWNKCWGYRGNSYRSGWFGDYDDEKHKVNERAKRQIIRKSVSYLAYHNINESTFEGLSENDPETLTLAKKKLGSNNIFKDKNTI